ncbi:hypothetical protein [Desulfoluna spongiiphila]|nr:hypothetical protein [Desulfoluna spongiiphila]
MTPKRLNPIAGAALRFVFYILCLGTMVLLVTWEAKRHTGDILFNENSILESLQATLLFLTAASAYLAGHLNDSDSPLASLLVGVASIAAIREFDFALDRYVFDGAWQAMALIVAAFTFIHAWHHRTALKEAVLSFIGRPSFGVMAAGGITVLVFSRLLGRQVLWQAVMHEGYMRSVKNAVEESCELLGYSLIFFGTLEFLYEAILARKNARHTAPNKAPQAPKKDKASPYLRKNSGLHF